MTTKLRKKNARIYCKAGVISFSLSLPRISDVEPTVSIRLKRQKRTRNIEGGRKEANARCKCESGGGRE